MTGERLRVKSLVQVMGPLKTKAISLVAFPGATMGKNPPAMQKTWVQSLGWDDPLEKEMVTHSSILVWRIPRTEEPGRLQSMGSQESRKRHD